MAATIKQSGEGEVEIQFDGYRMTVIVKGETRAWANFNGSFQKPYGNVIREESIPANVRQLVAESIQAVKENCTAKRNELFPRWSELSYNAQQLAKYDILEALNYMSASDLQTERNGIHGAAAKIASEQEAERFDNQ